MLGPDSACHFYSYLLNELWKENKGKYSLHTMHTEKHSVNGKPALVVCT